MCVFCKIINNEIPAYKIYEDEQFLALLDISQSTYGHTLVIPKQHVTNLAELDLDTVGPLFTLTANLAKKITKAVGTTDFNIINNNGPLAGQTVFHTHIHIIPRYENDNLQIKFSSKNLSADEFIELQNKIKSTIK